MKTYTEPARTIPVAAETEVLIAGGGPAGIGAALGAARAGAKVMIVEQSNALGGMATGGMMSHWSGGSTSPLLDEIMHRACESTSLPKNPNEGYSWCISHECLKSTLLQMMDEAGVKVQLYTQIADVIMDGQPRRGDHHGKQIRARGNHGESRDRRHRRRRCRGARGCGI